MIYNLYSVYDKVDSCHNSGIQLFRSDARASRSVVESVKSQNLQAKAQNRPLIDINEFELHKLGTFDDVTGEIVPLQHYENLPLEWKED